MTTDRTIEANHKTVAQTAADKTAALADTVQINYEQTQRAADRRDLESAQAHAATANRNADMALDALLEAIAASRAAHADTSTPEKQATATAVREITMDALTASRRATRAAVNAQHAAESVERTPPKIAMGTFETDLLNACRRFVFHRTQGPTHEINFALQDIQIAIAALGYSDTKKTLPEHDWPGPLPGEKPEETAQWRIDQRRKAVASCSASGALRKEPRHDHERA